MTEPPQPDEGTPQFLLEGSVVQMTTRVGPIEIRVPATGWYIAVNNAAGAGLLVVPRAPSFAEN
jgi:hypothetical protein